MSIIISLFGGSLLVIIRLTSGNGIMNVIGCFLNKACLTRGECTYINLVQMESVLLSTHLTSINGVLIVLVF